MKKFFEFVEDSQNSIILDSLALEIAKSGRDPYELILEWARETKNPIEIDLIEQGFFNAVGQGLKQGWQAFQNARQQQQQPQEPQPQSDANGQIQKNLTYGQQPQKGNLQQAIKNAQTALIQLNKIQGGNQAILKINRWLSKAIQGANAPRMGDRPQTSVPGVGPAQQPAQPQQPAAQNPKLQALNQAWQSETDPAKKQHLGDRMDALKAGQPDPYPNEPIPVMPSTPQIGKSNQYNMNAQPTPTQGPAKSNQYQKTMGFQNWSIEKGSPLMEHCLKIAGVRK